MPLWSPAMTFCNLRISMSTCLSSCSQQIYCRPILCATAAVVPAPPKKSRTISPGSVWALIIRSINFSDFWPFTSSSLFNSLETVSPAKETIAILFKSSYSFPFQTSSIGYLSGRPVWLIASRTAFFCALERPRFFRLPSLTSFLKSLFWIYFLLNCIWVWSLE